MMTGDTSIPVQELLAGVGPRLLHCVGRFFIALLWVRALAFIYHRGAAVAVPYQLVLQMP